MRQRACLGERPRANDADLLAAGRARAQRCVPHMRATQRRDLRAHADVARGVLLVLDARLILDARGGPASAPPGSSAAPARCAAPPARAAARGQREPACPEGRGAA